MSQAQTHSLYMFLLPKCLKNNLVANHEGHAYEKIENK